MFETCTKQKFTAMHSSFSLNLKSMENSNLEQFCSFSIHLPIGYRVSLQLRLSPNQSSQEVSQILISIQL